MRDAYIYDAVRTPRGKGKHQGALYEVKPIELLRVALEALTERQPIPTERIDDLIVGCVTAHSEQGGNIARAAALYAGWDSSVPGVQTNRFCASGLDAINMAAMKIRSGWEHLIVAGGMEAMSRVPMLSDMGPLVFDPVVSTTIGYVPQGIAADLIATREGFSRQELDEWALRSEQRAIHAINNQYFKKSLVPVTDSNGMVILDHEEGIHTETTLELLAELPPAFEQAGQTGYDAIVQMHFPDVERVHHHHTAGNSASFADGAAVVLLGSREMGEQLGISPRAKIVMAAGASVKATIGLEGAIPATHKVLALANLTPSDIDLWEINEAFAAPVLQFKRSFDIDDDCINVNGGSIAFGQPLGAVGAMLVSTLLDELERRDLKRGLVSLCMGGGMGVATVIERV